MWPDRYYFQQQMFYCSRWTKSMEKTFVDALLEQARRGNFRVGRENRNAVQHALYEVNKKHDTKVVLPWALSRVQHLQERHEVFNWLVQRPDVICNRTLRFVTAMDETWLEIARERKLTKCFVNAYEDLLEELNTLFALPMDDTDDAPPNDEAHAEEDQVVPEGPNHVMHGGPVDIGQVMEYMLHVPVPPDGADDVHVPVPPDDAVDVHEVIHIVSDTSSSTSSLARFIDTYYGTDSDADSVLPPPGVPSSIVKRKTPTPDKSPSNSSTGQASSSASNATPVKKKD